VAGPPQTAMEPRKLAELQARFQEAHVRHLMNETLRIAALEKAKDKVLSERNQLRTNVRPHPCWPGWCVV
jgi:hypothetical protein